jgi:DNA-binding HxlR family transcriptional regulator
MPLNVLILRNLATGARQRTELSRATGSPAPTTLRVQLKRLIEMGAVATHHLNRFPGVIGYELTPSGEDLLFVLDVIDGWLERAPDASLFPGSNSAKAAINALANGWSTGMLRVLAGGPLSLTELDGVIGSLSYPSLERRLAAMRLAGQVEARPGNGRGTPYAVTDWLRRGVAPIVAAVRWERRHRRDTTAAIGRIDAEAAFLLSVPLLRIPTGVSGTCRMAAEIARGRGKRLAGVMVEVRGAKVASCATELRGHPSAWALGPPSAWLSAVIDRDTSALELGGDRHFAGVMVEGLHEALFRQRHTVTT